MSAPGPGIYGKLPALGDFLSLRLPRSFTDPLDRFIQDGMEVSRGALGARWLDAYLVGPVWRFVLAPGVCGPAGAAGVLMPSVDRVGRYFPLVLASTLDADLSPADLLAGATWYDALEHAALATLADGATLDALEDRLAACGPPHDHLPLRSALAAPALGPGRVDIEHAQAAHLPWPALVGIALRGLPSFTLWWCRAAALVHAGMPRASDYAALIEPARAADTLPLLAHAAGDGRAPVPVGSAALGVPGIASSPAFAPAGAPAAPDAARDLLDLLATPAPPPRG